jgi:hypothetical protein
MSIRLDLTRGENRRLLETGEEASRHVASWPEWVRGERKLPPSQIATPKSKMKQSTTRKKK